MHNLGTVLRFEITRTLKKKSFWVMAFGFPLMMAVIFGIIFLSNQSTDAAVEKLKKQQFSLEITDRSGLVNPGMAVALGAKVIDDRLRGINDVKSGKLDGYIYYPRDLAKEQIEVYGRDAGIFNNGRYDSVAQMLLSLSVDQTVRPEIRAVVQKTTKTSVTTYRDGVVYEPFKEMILPGVFLVLFYMLIAFFGGQMLTSTTEEKENRVIEMILTTVEARTLIIGKIISLVLLALLQAVIIVVPALVAYLLFHSQLNLPAIDLTTLPVNWLRIGAGAAIFSLSFVMFTGLLVLIGSAVPTAKEASGFMGLIMMLIFGPLYAASLFVSAPDSPFVIFMSLFPLTAPIPLLLRNAVGNLTGWEVAVAIPLLALSSVCVLYLAVRVFRYGVLEYSRKLSLKEIFSRG
jgi:ABC-2 type transport system permease protein